MISLFLLVPKVGESGREEFEMTSLFPYCSVIGLCRVKENPDRENTDFQGWLNHGIFFRVCVINVKNLLYTSWKVSVFGTFLVRIFPDSDWIRRDTEYLSVFSPNAGRYVPEKTPNTDTFRAVSVDRFIFFISLTLNNISRYFRYLHEVRTILSRTWMVNWSRRLCWLHFYCSRTEKVS